jgi:carboxyl-terminal processing protease
MKWVRVAAAIASLGWLAGCGGGGGGGDNGDFPSPGGSYTPGVFQPSSNFANLCARPRTGTDPWTGSAFADRSGTRTDENNFLRSWTNELYLWYREVPDLNPASYETLDYFDLLKTNAVTASGRPKDRFHFTYDSLEYFQLSQSGVSLGYGAQWIVLASTPPRRIVVAFTEPNSPAASADVQRGDEVIEIDGVNAVSDNTSAGVAILNAALFPSEERSHTFRLRRVSGAEYTVTMTPTEVTSDPVQNVKVLNPTTDRVGYLVFNDHIATAEPELIDAIETLRDANVTDLVLDIRYNGGGYLDIAAQLAYMIAGPARTTGQAFERMQFNDKHPTTNPVTGRPLTPTPFHRTTLGIGNVTPGVALPTLNLSRVYVITSGNTCSASEAIINGLRGVDIDVYQIGTRTCGKPYGFYPRDNCGTMYFSIQFQGANAQGFGDYGDGFKPANDSSAGGVEVPGCQVADDFSRQLGDETEARIAAALAFRASGNLQCPAPSSFAPNAQLKSGETATVSDGIMFRNPFRENRILRDM